MKRLLLLAPLLLGGCISAPDLAALAADQNADCVTVSTPWGTLHFDRNWGCETPPPAK